MDQRRREHQLRSHNYCWCHKEEIARYGYVRTKYYAYFIMLLWYFYVSPG